ncbi:pyridoxamine 5'-phosphate oxidase family protein [Nocardioides sp. NPDC047086]|uniref:pyridoxamine 5'-phosphate oxidase family protein n=1 Tax=Nocardioides sp. NPDC047086 TaxID=3154810 RepID=UPI0034087112
MSKDVVRSVAELEETVGSRPPATILKSIGHLDDHCREFLARSPYVIASVFEDGEARIQGIGAPAVAAPDRLDLPGLTYGTAGDPIGVVALVPGYGETIRVNGRIGLDGGPHVRVEEAFLHCARCVTRSGLWEDLPGDREPLDVAVGRGPDLDAVPGARELLARSPFVALGTVDASGAADVSPKGDPAGLVRALDAATLAIPDRPGNRRTDTFHNLLERPEIALLALVPGAEVVLEVRGRARVTRDEELRERLVVQRNVPKVAVLVDVTSVELREDPALARLWSAQERVAPDELPKAALIWTDHTKLNETHGPANAARVY